MHAPQGHSCTSWSAGNIHIEKIISNYKSIITSNSYIDGLVQERRNSIANALELRLSCTNPSIYAISNITTLAKHRQPRRPDI